MISQRKPLSDIFCAAMFFNLFKRCLVSAISAGWYFVRCADHDEPKRNFLPQKLHSYASVTPEWIYECSYSKRSKSLKKTVNLIILFPLSVLIQIEMHPVNSVLSSPVASKHVWSIFHTLNILCLAVCVLSYESEVLSNLASPFRKLSKFSDLLNCKKIDSINRIKIETDRMIFLFNTNLQGVRLWCVSVKYTCF